jgi:hypothetical protein
MQRVRERLKVVLPLTIFPDPHAALHQHEVGREDADHLRWRCRSPPWAPSGCCTWLGYNMSIGVWVG